MPRRFTADAITLLETFREASIIGSKRCTTIDCRKQKIRIFERDANRRIDIKLNENNPLREEVAHFASCVLKNHSYINDASIGAKNVEVFEGIIGSTV